jgi:hypothetical protein
MEEGELANTDNRFNGGRAWGIEKVCEWCGVRYGARHEWGSTEHFYCSGRCRAAGYAAEHVRMDWLLIRVLGKAYAVIEGAGLNFNLELPRSGYPGRKAVRAEWRQFSQWAKRFEVNDVSNGAPVASPAHARAAVTDAPVKAGSGKSGSVI